MVKYRSDTRTSKTSTGHEALLSQNDGSVRQKRKYNRQKKWEVTSTKAPKFAGQAVFNLNKNMISVPSSKERADSIRTGIECQTTTFSRGFTVSHDSADSSHSTYVRPTTRAPFAFEVDDFNHVIHRQFFVGSADRVKSALTKKSQYEPTPLEMEMAACLEESRYFNPQIGIGVNYFDDLETFCILGNIGRSLEKSKKFNLGYWDPYSYRIAGLRLGLYASAARILGQCTDVFPYFNCRELLDIFDMPASMWRECVYDFMEALRYRKVDQVNLDSVKLYLLNAKDVVHSLQRDAPHLSEYWDSYLKGLDQYIDCLEQTKEGRTDWSHPKVYVGDSEQQSLNLTRSLRSNTVPVPSINARMSHPWGQDVNKFSGGNQYHRTHVSSFFVALSDRPAIADIALKGWTVFGQAIADTFDQYHRMYKILSFTSLPKVYHGFTNVLQSFLWSN